MNNKFIALIIVIIIAICGVSAFLLTQDHTTNNGVDNGTNTGNNTANNTVNNNNNTNNKTIPSENTNHKGVTDQNGVTASLNGPKYSAEGKSVKVTCKITNNANESINNVEILSQLITYNFGTIASGESKTYTTTLQIPTKASLIEDFDVDPSEAVVPNPFSFGSYLVNYNLNGESFQLHSNEFKISLV